MKLILITGIPGTGKSTIGDYLRDKYGFIHMDMECGDNIGKICANPNLFINVLLGLNKDVVVTWGFAPHPVIIGIVNLFKEYKFKVIWFDGNKEAARKAFVKRSEKYGSEYLKSAIAALDNQMNNIDQSNVIEKISPIQINTFNQNNVFKNEEEITKEILENFND